MSNAPRAKDRPKRRPLALQKVLGAEERQGFKRRYVNELPGRVENFLAAGWTVVCEEGADTSDSRAQDGTTIGTVVRKVVNTQMDARSKTAVLMEIPEDLYDEDFATKQRMVDEIELAIDPSKRKIDGADYGSISKKYS